MTLIKTCCIKNSEELQLAIQNGTSAVGFVSAMPSGPGVIDEKLIAELADLVPPGISSFLLTCKQDVPAIIDQQKRCRVNTIQLVDRMDHHSHLELKKAMPGIKIVQVIHVRGEESIMEAVSIQGGVDALLLDSGNPGKKIKELGGTGRTHNWLISRKIVEAVKVPVYLAGGLKPANVFEAVQVVRPFAVDVCSGIRTDDRLDKMKLKQFCTEVRAADLC